MNSDHMELALQKLGANISISEKEALKQQLAEHINHLLLHDFYQLVQLLYRVDVDEQKLKALLQAYPQVDAALLITDLLIVRQEEKAKARQAFEKDNDIAEEDKW